MLTAMQMVMSEEPSLLHVLVASVLSLVVAMIVLALQKRR